MFVGDAKIDLTHLKVIKQKNLLCVERKQIDFRFTYLISFRNMYMMILWLINWSYSKCHHLITFLVHVPSFKASLFKLWYFCHRMFCPLFLSPQHFLFLKPTLILILVLRSTVSASAEAKHFDNRFFNFYICKIWLQGIARSSKSNLFISPHISMLCFSPRIRFLINFVMF